LASVASFNILPHICFHGGPPVAPFDQFQGFCASHVSCCLGVMIEFEDLSFDVRVVGNIDELSSQQ
jgi:hypothetical protein